MITLKQLQKAIDDQPAGDGSRLRLLARELLSENPRLIAQRDNLLKPMRNAAIARAEKAEAATAELREALAYEAKIHPEDFLPGDYRTELLKP